MFENNKGINLIKEYTNSAPEPGDHFWRNELYVFSLVAILWVIHIFKGITGLNLAEFGLMPRNTEHFIGIFTSPFIHGDINHITSNTLAILILLSVLLNAYPKVSLWVLLFIHIVSGAMVWVIGKPGSIHIGISGIIYGIAFFLIFSGFFRRDIRSLGIAFFVGLVYGAGMLIGLIPKERVSWEAHLCGAIAGIVIAWLLKGVDKPIPHEFDLETKEPDKHFFE